jgi:beta-glucosidase
MAVQAMRAQRPNGPALGLAENVPACVPVLETQENIDAARKCFRETSIFLTPIMEGAYHPSYLENEGADAPKFTDDEMKIIGTPLDFVGLNLYFPIYVRHAPEKTSGWEVMPCGPEYPKMHMPWLNIGPSILYWTPRFVSELWKAPAIYVTENGCANPDRPTAANEIWDLGRMMYLQQHLIAAHRAVSAGYPLKGYFLWSLLDNFEWLWGMTKRFGMCYTNYTTLERTPKHSARFYADVIRRNAVGI